MFERLWNKLNGTDTLMDALRSPSDSTFLETFQRSTMFFLHLPPGYENGFDPKVSQEEFLAHIRKCAKDLSDRQEFVPLCILRENRSVLLLFTESDLAKPFVHQYVKQVQRAMPFQVLGIKGKAALKLLGRADSVIFNPASTDEHELSSERLNLLKKLRPAAKAAHAAQS